MDATLEAKKRDGRGKNEARRLRVSGQVPAVVYGARKEGQAPEGVPVAVDPKEVLRILHSESGANTLINLKLDGGESRVMVRDYQLDPITHQLLHADFYQLAMDKAITVPVPVVIKGEPIGVKQQGGLLDFVTREIQVQCLPTDIPEHIDLDVSELHLNQHAAVKDLPHPEGVKTLTDPDAIVVVVAAVKVEETPAVEGAAAVAPAEPEVIKKGKETTEAAGGDKEKKAGGEKEKK